MELEIDFEVWKPILENCYSISNLGRIKSNDKIVYRPQNKGDYFIKGKLMNHFDNGNGYRYVTICMEGKRKNYYMHKLVSEAFIPNPHKRLEVNHIDGNKANNSVYNLEWCTRSHNMQHAYSTGLQKTKGDKHNAIRVIHISDKIIFDCIKDVSDYYHVKYSKLKELLNRSAHRKHKTHLYQNLVRLDKYIERNPAWAYEKGYSIKRLNK